MLSDSLTEIRDEAHELGIPWSHVTSAARELRHMKMLAREPLCRTRRLAWEFFCHWAGRSAGCHPFWRCGFDHVLSRLADRGYDYTSLPHHDKVATMVAGELPEWTDRCDDLWEFLAEPYEPMPSRETLLRQAVEELARRERQPVPDVDVPEEF